MRIKIEHESARRLAQDGHLQESNLTQSVVLDFTIDQQKLSNWCWAAIASSIGKFYKTSQLNQEQVVSRVLNLPARQLPEMPDNNHLSNQQVTLDKSLSIVNCYSHWSLGRPSYERLMLEISSGCLPCARIEWLTGGAHYLVIKGINPMDSTLYIEDSLHGSSIIPYQDFPKQYAPSGGIWTDTFWTAPKKNHELKDGSSSTEKPLNPQEKNSAFL